MKDKAKGCGRIIMTCDPVSERTVLLAQYVVCTGATVRDAAQRFGISKSTVHKDLNGRLARIDAPLYRRVRLVLERNKSERHLRGGLATRAKYRLLRGR